MDPVSGWSQGIVVFIIILILVILILWGVMIFVQTGNEQTLFCNAGLLPQGTPVNPNDIFCGVNTITGIKRCPLGPTGIFIDITKELCTRQNTCDPETLFPLDKDQGTVQGKICPENNPECRCLANHQCPEWIVGYFTRAVGNPSLPSTGQILSLGQSNDNKDFFGNPSTVPPLILEDPANQFCLINSSTLPFVAPGICTTQIKDCFTIGPSGNGLCTNGTLAIIDSGTGIALDNEVVGCVEIDKGFVTDCISEGNTLFLFDSDIVTPICCPIDGGICSDNIQRMIS